MNTYLYYIVAILSLGMGTIEAVRTNGERKEYYQKKWEGKHTYTPSTKHLTTSTTEIHKRVFGRKGYGCTSVKNSFNQPIPETLHTILIQFNTYIRNLYCLGKSVPEQQAAWYTITGKYHEYRKFVTKSDLHILNSMQLALSTYLRRIQ